MENIKCAAMYARVSTIDKNQGPELQLRELRVYAQEKGFVVKEYVDKCSGTTDKRPEFMRLMADARSGSIDVVLTWKIDRFSRSLRHLLNTLSELQEIGVSFVSLKENLDLSSSVGKLLSHILGAFAEFEKNILAERVRSGMANAKAKGKHIGRNKKAIDDSLIVLVLEQYNNNISQRQIAKQLGVTLSTVYRVLKIHKG